MLRPLDIVVCLKHVASAPEPLGYELLARELGIALSSAHRSVGRLQQAGLLTGDRYPINSAILELVVHGVRYVYYVKPGQPTRGVPTAHAAPPLSDQIVSEGDVPVWPDPEGSARGYAVKPLDKSAPKAALRDPTLYELLALVDAMRIGRARERQLARDALRERIG